MSFKNVVIVNAARGPRGRGKPLTSSKPGALAGLHPQELAAQVLQGLIRRVGIDASHIDDVVLGCVTQVDDQSANIARHAVLSAGFPAEVPATTLTRACGSGLQAIQYGAMAIASGAQHAVIAGGVESMSRVPMGSDGRAPGGKSDRTGVGDGGNEQLRRRVRQVPQGIAADIIATLDGITRADVDAFALRSQTNAAQAIVERRFASSLIPIHDPVSCETLLTDEEYPRPTTASGLGALPPAFAALGTTLDDDTLRQLRHRLATGVLRENERMSRTLTEVGLVDHVHTAGNSSGIADGAAAVLMTSRAFAAAHGLPARGRLRATAVLGSDPVLMLTAPGPVSRRALRAAGMVPRDIDLWEINEAFAAVPVKMIRDLEIDPDRVNVNGGAIALGHPLGATGAILLGTALDELERRDASTALVTLCIAGGQGIAAIVERDT